jgi:hypothetical protein
MNSSEQSLNRKQTVQIDSPASSGGQGKYIQLEHVIAGYLRQIWDNNDWFYKGLHGFRPGSSCASQVITVCQDTADFLDEGVGIRDVSGK